MDLICFSVRGVLGSTVMFCYNIGMILAFVLGAYCDYGTTPKVVIGLTIVFAVSFYFLPETPTVLIKQNKITVRNHEIFRRKLRSDRKLSNFRLNFSHCRRPKSPFDFIKIYEEKQMTTNLFSLKFRNSKKRSVAIRKSKVTRTIHSVCPIWYLDLVEKLW